MGTHAAIRSGMFIMPFHDPAKPAAQCYDEDLELIVRAEELGFGEFWIGEHHTMKYENIVMPEIFIARALGETKTIRMGPCPGLHPAAQPGTRRLPPGVSRSSVEGQAQPLFRRRQRHGRPGALRSRAQERRGNGGGGDRGRPLPLVVGPALPFRREVLEDPPREDRGYRDGHRVHPQAYQKPHPPIAIPGMSRNSPSMRTAARRGHQPFGHCLVPGNVLADNWNTYEEAGLEAGRQPDRSDWKIARSIFLADTTKEAQQTGPDQLARQVLRVYRPPLRQGTRAAGSTSATSR